MDARQSQKLIDKCARLRKEKSEASAKLWRLQRDQSLLKEENDRLKEQYLQMKERAIGAENDLLELKQEKEMEEKKLATKIENYMVILEELLQTTPIPTASQGAVSLKLPSLKRIWSFLTRSPSGVEVNTQENCVRSESTPPPSEAPFQRPCKLVVSGHKRINRFVRLERKDLTCYNVNDYLLRTPLEIYPITDKTRFKSWQDRKIVVMEFHDDSDSDSEPQEVIILPESPEDLHSLISALYDVVTRK